MKEYFVYCNKIPEGVDRTLLLQLFGQFGVVKKIYIPPSSTYCKIYFNDIETVDKAVSLSGKSPYFLELLAKSEERIEKKSDNLSSVSVTSSNSNSMSYNDNDEIYAETSQDYYNIHGISVPTLIADDGRIYLPLDEVKKIGFELFEDSNIPRNINLSQQTLKEFEVYMNIKARKYINKMRCNIPENVVEEVKNEIINGYVNNNGLPQKSMTHQVDNMSLVSKPNLPSLLNIPAYNTPPKSNHNNNFENQRNFRNFANKETPAQINASKSSRKYSSPVDNRNQNAQGAKSNKNWHSKNQNVIKKSTNPNIPGKENINPTVQDNSPQRMQSPACVARPTMRRVELPLNQEVRVILAHIVSEKQCWAFKSDDESKMEKLLYEINLEVNRKSNVTPVVGQIYAATYCNVWYRAQVIEVTPALKVQYLDFGNFNDEELKDIRELSQEIISQPIMAVCLNFKNLPKTKLQDSMDLKIIASKKNDDGSYIVEEVTERQQSSPELQQLNVVPAGKLVNRIPKERNVESKLNQKTEQKTMNGTPSRRTNVQTENRATSTPKQNTTTNTPKENRTANTQTENKSENILTKATTTPVNVTNKPNESTCKLTLKEKLAKMSGAKKEVRSLNPNRKSVVDLMEGDTGMVDCIEKLDNNTCLCFILPQKFLDEVTLLENIKIGSDSKMNFVGEIGDTVSVYKEDDDTWVRGTIVNVKNDKYIVALIDYGTLIMTNAVCQLGKEFVDIPEFTCVCTGTVECINLFEKGKGDVGFTNDVKNKITVGFNNVFYTLNCKRWDPFSTSKLTINSNEPIVYTTAPSIKELKDEDRVILIMLNDGKILVRNKESSSVLRKINEEISKYKAISLKEKPVLKQLVLCSHDTLTGLCRGIIESLNEHYAEVNFIDYGFVETVPLKNLMSISESLAKEDFSLIPIVLKDFEDGKFSDEDIECIGTYCTQAKKLQIKKYPNNVVDLIINSDNDNEVTLSSKLNSLSASPDVPLFKDMPKWELKTGIETDLICISIENEDGSIVFIPNENTSEFCDLNNKIMDYANDSNNQQSYHPVIDEVCLAKYDEEWYRAQVVEINTAVAEYKVYYFDYGNTATISSVDIRKIPEEFTKYPAVAVIGFLTEQLNFSSEFNEVIIKVIKNDMLVGNSYDVNILRKLDNGKYEIEIPSLHPKLMEVMENK